MRRRKDQVKTDGRYHCLYWLYVAIAERALEDIRSLGKKKNIRSGSDWNLDATEAVTAVRFWFDDYFEISEGVMALEIIDLFPEISNNLEYIRDYLFEENKHLPGFIEIVQKHTRYLDK